MKFDDDDTKKPGWKFAEYEFKGYPVRIAIGPRDMENGTVEVARRDTMEKQVMQVIDLADKVEHLLDSHPEQPLPKGLGTCAKDSPAAVDTYEEFKVAIEEGGFIHAHWDGTAETEERVKKETKATIRCIPLEGDMTSGKVHGDRSAERSAVSYSHEHTDGKEEEHTGHARPDRRGAAHANPP